MTHDTAHHRGLVLAAVVACCSFPSYPSFSPPWTSSWWSRTVRRSTFHHHGRHRFRRRRDDDDDRDGGVPRRRAQPTSVLATTTTTTSSSSSTYGPPPALDRLTVGGPGLVASRRDTVGDGAALFTVVRVSNDPDAFVARGVTGPDERDRLATTTTRMRPAETSRAANSATSRPNCDVAWASNADDPFAAAVLETAASTFLTRNALDAPDTAVEDLQVLRYRPGGAYVLHHDGEPRFLTVIHYLNGVAGTWFPFAVTGDAPTEDDVLFRTNTTDDEMRRAFLEARRSVDADASRLDFGDGAVPGTHGLLVASDSDDRYDDRRSVARVGPGDALVFYNHRRDDGYRTMNWRAMHAGLPNTATATESDGDGEKWIANHWFRTK